MRPDHLKAVCALAGASVLAAAGAAAAQPGYAPGYAPAYDHAPGYAGGVTVYGHPRRGSHRLPNGDPELKRRVSYADLDLATPQGQAALRWRIDQTAQELCDRLGEPEEFAQNSAVLPTCQAAARESASQQVQAAIDAARYRVAYAPPAYAPPVYAPPAYGPPPVYAPAPVYSPAPAYGDPCGCAATTYAPPPPPHWDRHEHVGYVGPGY